jgi:type VI protein secretion system component VasF
MSWLSWKLGLDKNKELRDRINAALKMATNSEVRKLQSKFMSALTAKGVSLEDADTAWYVLLDVLDA